jgi:hypothetical protein
MNIKQVVLPDGSIGIEIDDGSKPDGFVEDIDVDSVSSVVPQQMIDECERLSQKGEVVFIFDKYTSIAIKKVNSSVDEKRDLTIDEILSDDEYYIAGVEEFDSMPSRFSFYDTETKMTCRWSRYKLVTDFFSNLGFTPGMANLGPEYEQSFILSVQNNDEDYKCILRLQPNLTLDLISESVKTSGIHKRTLYCFFSRQKILSFLSEVAPDSYKSVIRNIKLEKVLE